MLPGNLALGGWFVVKEDRCDPWRGIVTTFIPHRPVSVFAAELPARCARAQARRVCRIADFQSGGPGCWSRADWKSATRQVGNLRHELHKPKNWERTR